MAQNDNNDNALVVNNYFTTAENFNLVQRIANALSSSDMVPAQYRGKQNIANCVIAINMARRIDVDPLTVMQNLYVIQGKPTWSTAFLISMFNASGKFEPIRYRQTGVAGTDSHGVIAYTAYKATGDLIEGEEVTLKIAKAEGWTNKNGSKWKTMPGLMLRYRAAAWLIRTTAPELSLGLTTREEAIDVLNSSSVPKNNDVVIDKETGEIFETTDNQTVEVADETSNPEKEEEKQTIQPAQSDNLIDGLFTGEDYQ